jgi:exopolysaccharide biosynthesis polyprenyl glycosylphosphotransferase
MTVREETRAKPIVTGIARNGRRLRAREVAATGRVPWWRDVLRRRLLAVADLTTSLLATVIIVVSVTEGAWGFVAIPIWLLLAKLFGLYDRDHRALRHLTIDELPTLAGWAASGVIAVALTLDFFGPGGWPRLGVRDGMSLAPSDWRFLLAWLVAVLCAVTLRAMVRWLWRRVTSPEATIILGDGALAASLRRKLELFPDMHLKLVRDEQPVPSAQDSAEKLGDLAETADRLVVASQRIDPDVVDGLAASCREHHAKLSVVSPLRGRTGPLARLSQVADLPVFELDTWDVSRSTMMLKRTFDVITSAALLILSAPLFPLIALGIRLDSRGPVFFTQLRAGLGGRPFRMYKFRTMAIDAEERLDEVVSLEELNEPMFKLRRDPRVTRFGRLLRRLSLDELPQLFNVLKGDMSIVGPRPEQLELVERYEPQHLFRLDVKPGVTGPMQVCGRGELTFAERLAVEQDYIEHMTLARDLRILLLTIPVIWRGTGAF